MKPFYLVLFGLVLTQCKIIDDGDILKIEQRNVKNIKIKENQTTASRSFSYHYTDDQLTSTVGDSIDATYEYYNSQLAKVNLTLYNGDNYSITFQNSSLRDTGYCFILGDELADTIQYINNQLQNGDIIVSYSKLEAKTIRNTEDYLHIVNVNETEGQLGAATAKTLQTTLSDDVSYVIHHSHNGIYHLHNTLFPNIFTSKDERLYTALLKNYPQLGSFQSDYIKLELEY